jgi:hypothetical protein
LVARRSTWDSVFSVVALLLVAGAAGLLAAPGLTGTLLRMMAGSSGLGAGSVVNTTPCSPARPRLLTLLTLLLLRAETALLLLLLLLPRRLVVLPLPWWLLPAWLLSGRQPLVAANACLLAATPPLAGPADGAGPPAAACLGAGVPGGGCTACE